MYKNSSSENLKDIRNVSVDADLPKSEKIAEHIRQLGGNPKSYKCGKYTINEIFPTTGPTIEDCLTGMVIYG